MYKITINYLIISIIFLISCKKNTAITGGGGPDIPPKVDPPKDPIALVYFNENNELTYAKYANEGESNLDNTVPDFSSAGYRGGGIALPQVPVKKTISAIAGDNLKHIQDAIDEVSELPLDASGARGAVLLQAGLYEVEGTLTIKTSGVVLRGEGQGANGTVIKATKKAQHNLIEIKGSGSGFGEVTGTRKAITQQYVPTGSATLIVESATGFSVGNDIAVTRTPNQVWIDDLQMGQYGWTPTDYKISFERKITAISGNTITLNAPVVDPIQSKYGGGYIFRTNITGRVSECGVENLRLVSYYASDEDENHGWNGIKLTRSENCWVRQVTAMYFGYSCVTVGGQSVYNTIEECAMLDPKSITTGSRKYSFNIESSSAFNLFQRCYARGGRHDFVTGSNVPGPNVFLDSYATDTHSDIGPHHRWATGLLFDNIRGGQIRVQNRKDMGTGHGWAGAQSMFWNCQSYKEDFKVESAKGSRNWGIGCSGTQKNGTGYWERWGAAVTPRSLYIEQLKKRLGNKAVSNVITTGQMNGTITEQLAQWAGEGKLQMK
jgi:hypothetical protein